jgi:beta-1,4-mannosyltransferase
MRILAWPLSTPASPYTDILYSHLGAGMEVEGWPGNLLKKYDVWHVHWPDSLLGIPRSAHAAYKVTGMFAAMDFLKMRGTKVVWTMHNFASHEARHPRLENWFWRKFIPRVDGAISLSAAGLALAMEKFPRLREVPAAVIPHGHYRAQYPPPRSNGREELGIAGDARVAMFFGTVRGYKNIEALLKAFRGVRDPRAGLYVAGRPNSDALARRIAGEAERDARVKLRLGFVDDADVTTLLSAANVVTLPYREILNSGAALLALSFNRPVLVPERGSMGELKEIFGEEWVKTYRGELTSALLEEALHWAEEPRATVCRMPEKFEWSHIGADTARFFERVVAGKRGEPASEKKAEERFLPARQAGLRSGMAHPPSADEKQQQAIPPVGMTEMRRET